MANISTAECATELQTDPRTLRKFLRANAKARGMETPGKGARWELKGDSRSLSAMKKQFIAWNAEQTANSDAANSE